MHAKNAAKRSAPRSGEQNSVPELIISLLVSFVMAMTARGFVLEGFVIPTGSMAPTLMGQHINWESPQTGWSYAFNGIPSNESGVFPMWSRSRAKGVPMSWWDPMFGLRKPVVRRTPSSLLPSSGDRVIVLKSIYPFFEPDRFDVVVFKNPTDPVGPTQNYIKRLVGLPDEQFVIVDGDIFRGALDGAPEALQVVRKPEFVQRAVWQPVYDSSFQPIDLVRWEESSRSSWWGAPFVPESGDGDWTIGTDQSWSCSSAGPTSLSWNLFDWPITDFNAYNVFRTGVPPLNTSPYPMSDLRITGVIDAEDPGSFEGTRLSMQSRGIDFVWSLKGATASLDMTELSSGKVVASKSVDYTPPDHPFRVEFWQVDQQMWLFADGDLLLTLPFDQWSPEQRFLASFPGITPEQYLQNPTGPRPAPPAIQWSFSGSPFTLRNVTLDRDLFYRPTQLDRNNQKSENGPYLSGNGFGTNFLAPSRVEPDQFVMCGDNSAASRDGRIWGRPHPLSVSYSGDDAPFVVPRRNLIGKAFSVYWPAPLSFPGTNSNWVPNFGKLRFIR